MNFRKWLCTLLALAMLFAMVPAALMEGVTSDNVDEQPEEYDTELGAPEEGEEASIVMNAFELTGPEAPEVPEEPAEPKAVEVVAKGFPTAAVTTTDFATDSAGNLTAYTGTATEVVIPEKLSDGTNETTVTGIYASAFAGKNNITSVTIPATVSQIEDYAFNNCSDLATVKFLEGSWMTYLGEGTFEDCAKLTSITLPDGLTDIGDYCFSGCELLASITLPDGLTVIGEDCFFGCKLLASITLPNTLSDIWDGCFSGCVALTGVKLPEKINYIHSDCFAGCTSLTNDDVSAILANIEYIESQAFMGCTGLTAVTIPESVQYAYGNPFWGCTSLTDIYLDYSKQANYSVTGVASGTGAKLHLSDNATKIPAGIYTGDDTLTSLADILKPNIVAIGQNAFWDCDGLVTIEIPNTVESVENNAFWDCKSLTTVTVNPGEDAYYSVSNFYTGKYAGTTPLPIVEMGSDAKTIPGGFYADSEMTEIVIPANIVNIGDYAFQSCEKAEKVTFADGIKLKRIGGDAFNNCNFKEITIPATVCDLGGAPFSHCVYLETINVTTGSLDDYEDGDDFTYNTNLNINIDTTNKMWYNGIGD